MRLGSLLASIGLASSLLTACSSDGTLVDLPHARDGLNGGSGSPDGVVTLADGGAKLEDAGDAAHDAAVPVRAPVDPIATEPIATADASPEGETDSATPAADASAQATIAGCACGCADPCLTVLIGACKAPTTLLEVVCPKVPATCACEATCTPAPPAPPSLDTCVAQFLLTGA
jgi:hypothetical protein